MRCLHSLDTRPWYNIAAEEYLLRKQEEDVFLVYRNDTSVILGKHQNAYAETNYPFLHQHSIPLIRRISGGGTVFHDAGNLNYTLIRRGESGKLIDFEGHSRIIIDFLKTYGLTARFEGKNDLKIDGLKFSGNAEHVFKDRVLHHGTLLFEASLDLLHAVLKTSPNTYSSRAVASNPGRVMNLREVLPEEPIDSFSEKLLLFAGQYYGCLEMEEWHPGKQPEIQALAEDKYKSWEWNIAYAPAYTFSGKLPVSGRYVPFSLEVNKGWIEEVILPEAAALAKALKGKPHRYEVISEMLKKVFPVADDLQAMTDAFFW